MPSGFTEQQIARAAQYGVDLSQSEPSPDAPQSYWYHKTDEGVITYYHGPRHYRHSDYEITKEAWDAHREGRECVEWGAWEDLGGGRRRRKCLDRRGGRPDTEEEEEEEVEPYGPENELVRTAWSMGIVTEGVVKGFMAVGPALLILSLSVGAMIWLARLGSRTGGLE